ncbi:MAG: T9SS type A sorting domain-containing protein [Saprospiraceae bacterium]|nr:T9SS type A sorting domain-containing protein [Saprospiraceae bacterium]
MKKYVLCMLLVAMTGLLFSQNSEKRKEQIREIIKEKMHLNRFKKQLGKNLSNIIQRSNKEIKLSTANSLDVSEAEPYIAINPTDTNNIVVSFMDFTLSLDFRIYYTLDGGTTWQQSTFNPGEVFAQTNPLLQIAGGGDPIMDFDKNGKLYYGWLYLGVDASFMDGQFLVYWAWSNDKGASFQTAPGDDIYISKGGLSFVTGDLTNFGDGIFDRPWFSVDKSNGPNANTLYCAGLFVPNNQTTLAGNGIVLKRKLPNQDKFEYSNTEVYLSESSQFSNVEVDDNGVVHVTYSDTEESSIRHSKSIDGGLSFEASDSIGIANSTFQSGLTYIHSRENPAPNIAKEPGTNNLYLVWSSFGLTDLIQGYFSTSKDGGETWSKPLNIAVMADDTMNHCLMPVVAANSMSGVTVSWYSVSTQKISDYKVMRSMDGGQSFEKPITVTSKSTDFSVYPTGGFSPVFFGDYNKSINTDCRNLTIFSDGRESLGPKIYISVVDYCNKTVIPELTTVTDKISFRILPNPVKSTFQIAIISSENIDAKIMLLNPEGKLLENLYSGEIGSGNITKTFNLKSNLPSGVYFILFDSKNGKFVRKLVKE